MKYLLMMHTPTGGPYQIASWPQQDIKAHIAFMVGFAKKLKESGELASAEGLSAPDQAKRVRAGLAWKSLKGFNALSSETRALFASDSVEKAAS